MIAVRDIVFRVRNDKGQIWDGDTPTGFGNGKVAEFESREEAFGRISDMVRLARRKTPPPMKLEIVEYELVRRELGAEHFDVETSTAMFQRRLRMFFENKQGLKIGKADRAIALALKEGWTPCALASFDTNQSYKFQINSSPLSLGEDFVIVSEVAALRKESAIFVIRAKWPNAVIFDLTDFWKHIEETGAPVPVRA